MHQPTKMEAAESSSSSSSSSSSYCVANARYTYIHDDDKNISVEAMDAHHVFVLNNNAKSFISSFSTILLLILITTTIAFSLFFLNKKGESNYLLILSLISSALFLVKKFIGAPVEKESVIIMPAFGVQLETQYRSGRIIHCFIPIDNILKPVLNECVTPITCYWSLSLIVRDKEELVLVFKELGPPVKILIPIWKALCNATDRRPGTHVPIG